MHARRSGIDFHDPGLCLVEKPCFQRWAICEKRRDQTLPNTIT